MTGIDAQVQCDRMKQLYGEPRQGFREDRKIEQLRVPPQSIESEQGVLGGLMLAPDSWQDVADLLEPDDFYRRDHQLIFAAIKECAEANPPQPYDAVLLGEWFEARGQADLVDGGSYLVHLASTTWSAANIRAYAKIVADKSTLRALIEAGTASVNDGFQPEGRATDEVIASAAARHAALTQRNARDGGLKMVRSGLAKARQEIEDRYNGTAELGLSSPWANVRDLIPGIEDTDLVVVAGRPSMGKTIVGMEYADHAASEGRNVAVFSLEMSSTQLITRLISRRAHVDQQRMRARNGMDQSDWAAVTQAQRELYSLPIAIDDSAELTISAIRARASRMHAKVSGGLGLIVLDYLQLVSGEGRKDERRHDEITKISRGLKLLAKQLKCPVIALSQLNRSLETRTDKRPMMSDLRESGAIEQDADIIAFLYRDDYYTKDECGAPGVSEFIVAKQRNGATGTAYLRHHLAQNRFEDYHGRKPYYGKPKTSKTAPDGFDEEFEPSGRDRAAGPDR